MERHEAIVAVTDYGLFSVKEEVAKSRQLDAPQYSAPEVVYLFFWDCLLVYQLYSLNQVMMKMIPTTKSDVYR